MEEIIKARAITVGVCYQDEETFNYEMKELKGLADACNMEVVSTLIQYLESPSKATYVGKGKLIELSDLVKETEAEVVIFNDELSPATLSNIADALDAEILDRTMLILEIFKKRARTKEATLQVALAERNYMLPRLIGANKNLSRIGGGGGGGAGARRGSGETKLELDRRKIENEIIKIKQDLADIVSSRQTTRNLRKKNDVPVVAFVGYTNAGKSSTINSILKIAGESDELKDVFVKDMLFATLETSSRAVKLNNNHEFLITDTVGFVQKLPHHLVESFKSTLEEIKESSLIIHVVDAASPYADYQIKTTLEVLEKLDCKDIPMIYAFNKSDLVTNELFIPKDFQPMLYISNKTGKGLNELLESIDQTLFPNQKRVKLLIPYTNGEIYNKLKEHSTIHNTEYANDGIFVDVTLSDYLFNLYQKYIKEVVSE